LRLHLIAAATFVASAALAACSSSVGITPPPPAPLPSPVPAVHYAGTLTQTYTYLYGYPSPEPPNTSTTAVKGVVTVSPTTGPGLPSGTNDVHVKETDTTPLQSSSTVSDSYVRTSASEAVLYGSVSELKAPQGGQSTHTTTSYVTPQVLSRAHGTWTNSPAGSVDEKYSDRHYQDRTIAANGSYDEKGTAFSLSGKMVATEILEKSSGAGGYTGPFEGCPAKTSFLFTAAPTISVSLVSKPPVAGCEQTAASIPDWYPAAPTLYSEQDRVKSSVVMPSSCGASAGQHARLTERTTAGLDTIIGYREHTDVSVFGPLDGPPVCIVLVDKIDNYYDWQGDQIAFFAFTDNGHPVSTILTDESVVLSGGSSGGSSAIVVAAQTHFGATLDAVRARLRDAMIRRFAAMPNSTGGTR
jgi:hypothetical protein